MSTNIGLAVQKTAGSATPTTTTITQPQQQQQENKKEEEEITLSKLFDYYMEEVVSRIKYYRYVAERKRVKETLDKKTCDRRCNRVDFSYQDCVIIRHPNESHAQEFVKKLIDADYRHCKDCKRLIPKSQAAKSKTHKTSISPASLCPCCGSRMAYLSVLIRKTKMKKALFKFEGY